MEAKLGAGATMTTLRALEGRAKIEGAGMGAGEEGKVLEGEYWMGK